LLGIPEDFPVSRTANPPFPDSVRFLGVSLAIAVLVFVVTAGHVLFLPFVFLPLGLLTFGGRRRTARRRRLL
jgi:hypothetical protein